MSLLAITSPVQAAIPAVEAAAGSLPLLARSLLGFGVFGVIATLALTFKPMLKGLFQAALLIVKPRTMQSTLLERSRAAGASLLQRLASDFEHNQPDQAAELRWLAARG